MSNDYYNHGSYPSTGAAGASAAMRAELDAVTAGFAKMPVLAGAAGRLVIVNAGATALDSTSVISISGTTVTFSGAVTGITDLTTTGNTALGNAVTDTLSVGGSTVKSASGTWTIAAPSSGVALTVNSVAATAALILVGDSIFNSESTGNLYIRSGSVATHTGLIVGVDKTQSFAYIQSIEPGTSYSTKSLRLNPNGAATVIGNGALTTTFSPSGNVTIAAPSSGTTFTAAGSSGRLSALLGMVNIGDTITLTTGANIYTTGTDTMNIGTAGAATFDLWSNSQRRILINSAGNVTINAPSSGIAFTTNAVAGSGVAAFKASAGVSAYISVAGNGLTPGSTSFDLQQDSTGAVDIVNRSNTRMSFYTNSLERLQIAAAGGITLNAPASGTAFTITGGSGVPLLVNGSAASASYMQWQTAGVTRGYMGVDGGGILGTGTGTGYGVRAEAALLLLSGAGSFGVTVGSSGNITNVAPSGGRALVLSPFSGAAAFAINSPAAQLAYQAYAVNATDYGFIGVAGASTQLINDVGGIGEFLIRTESKEFRLSTNGGTSSALRVTVAGLVDVVAGSGNLRMAGTITRAVSAEQTCPSTTGAISVAHGGPRVPDVVYAVLRCKTAEANYSVGDEVQFATISAVQNVMAYGTSANFGLTYERAAAPAVLNKTTGATIGITAANWRVVFYAIWL